MNAKYNVQFVIKKKGWVVNTFFKALLSPLQGVLWYDIIVL